MLFKKSKDAKIDEVILKSIANANDQASRCLAEGKEEEAKEWANFSEEKTKWLTERMDKKKERFVKVLDISLRTVGTLAGVGASVIGVILPLKFYNAWVDQNYRFEIENVATSHTFKEIVKNFKPVAKV